ncbi:hypothetical protein [Paenibacillus phocaensis]|uniref:hypothetical protein n=1 Tax=Paenibacillus phocaensis TaxID=1776378 RepID=UPI000839B7D2|nr:hypothetical protein [Paenibacillus phocaensis]
MPREEQAINPVEQLLFLYRKVMDHPCFDQYQLYESDITLLFERIMTMQLSDSDRELLSEVRLIHEQITNVILLEKGELVEQIDLLERKKRVSDHYGRLSNTNNVGAFFVDFKK